MKIYKLRPDPSYRLMYPEKSVHRPGIWEFHGEPLADRLMNFQAHFDKTKDLPEPDIAYLGMTTFAFRKDVADTLCELLEEFGELLPFRVDKQIWYAYNVTNKLDALDEDKSTFAIDTGTIKLHLTKSVFDASRLPGSCVFKIPQDRYTEIFCVDSQDSDEGILNSLFAAVHAHGYVGIQFENVS